MTTQLELPPPAPAPARGRSWGQAIDLGVRAVLLLVLVTGWLVTLPSHAASPRSVDAFTAALREHRVTSVDYLDQARAIHWSEGWLHWYQTDLGGVELPPVVGSTATVDSSGGEEVSADLTWLQAWLDRSGGGLQYREVTGDTPTAWWHDVTWGPLGSMAAGATVLAFLIMLSRWRHRFANRWGWLWLFVIGGAVGPMLYLVLEPAPLWRRNPNDRPFPPRPAAGGGVGLMVAIGLHVVPWLFLLLWALWSTYFPVM